VLSLGCCAEYVIASTKPQTLAATTRSRRRHHPAADSVSFAQALVIWSISASRTCCSHVRPGAARHTIVVQGQPVAWLDDATQLAHAHGAPVIATCRRAAEESYLLGSERLTS